MQASSSFSRKVQTCSHTNKLIYKLPTFGSYQELEAKLRPLLPRTEDVSTIYLENSLGIFYMDSICCQPTVQSSRVILDLKFFRDNFIFLVDGQFSTCVYRRERWKIVTKKKGRDKTRSEGK